MNPYQKLILRQGLAFEVQPALAAALCEAALSLAHDTGREELRAAIEQGRFTDGSRRLLILPPVRDVLLAAQEAALLVADGKGGVARRAGELADRIADAVGYRKAPKRFRVILADPPWKYDEFGGKGHGRALDHYKTMPIEDLKNLRVDLGWGPRRIKDLADPRGCVLLMWVTSPKVEDGLALMRAWGFPVVTKGFAWFKTNKNNDEPHFGQGVWTRSSDEDCWLGRIGKVTPKRLDVRREIRAPVRGHSRKPREIYDRIESLWDGPYLELFSRSRRPGWCSVGNDAAVRQVGVVRCPRSNG